MQRQGIDFNETFSPVVRYDSLRVLLAVVTQDDLEMLSFDVCSAFLYGDLHEKIYMEVPEGVSVENSVSASAGVNESGMRNVVCMLKNSLYGLKQAPRCWNIKFNTFLRKYSFKECEADKCIYVGEHSG